MEILPITRPMQRRCCQTLDARIWGTVNKPQMPHPLLSLCQAPGGIIHSLSGCKQAWLVIWSPGVGRTQEGLDLIHLSPT